MSTSLSSNDLRNAKFTTAFRGYDSTEVRAFLARMADALDAERRAAAETTAIAVGHVDRDRIDVSEDAKYTDDRLVENDEAIAQMREQAHREAEELLTSARNEASVIVGKANDEAARIILRARAESRGRPTSEGTAVVEAAYADSPNDPMLAREQARVMITEARAVREKILADLAKRRRVAHVQLEQLRVAREKLQETLREARRIVDDSARDLSTADVEARIAAENAGRRIAAEPLPSTADLESELWGGRHVRTSMVTMVTENSSVDEVVVDEVLVDAIPVGELEVVSESSVVVDGSVVVDSLVDSVVVESGVVEAPSIVAASPIDAESVQENAIEENAVEENAVEENAVEGHGTSSDMSRKKAPNVEELFARLRSEREKPAAAATDAAAKKAAEINAKPKTAKGSNRSKNPEARNQDGKSNVIAMRADDLSIDLGTTTSVMLDLTNDGSTAAGATTSLEFTPDNNHSPRHTPNPADDVAFQAKTEGAVAVLETESALAIHAPVLQLVDTLKPHDEQQTSLQEENETSDELAFVLGPLQSSLIRAVKRRLHDEQSAALTSLRLSRGPADVSRLVGEETVQLERLVQELVPLFVDAYKVGAERSHRSVDDSSVASLVTAQATQIATAVTSTVREELAEALGHVGESGNESREVNDAIASCYRSWTTDRITAIVDGRLKEAFVLGIAS
jgi:DivIVA domain-containing protein